MIKVALLAAAALAAAPALAQDSGWYVGGHIGQVTYSNTCEEFNFPGISCDDKDTAWRVLLGHQINRNVAVEVAYTHLGEVSARGPGGTAAAEATAFELVGLGMAPVAERVSLYGKAGIYRGEVDARIDTTTLVGSASESNVGFTFGAGAAFHLARQASLRVEWQRYLDVGGDDTGEDDLDVLSLGVLFRF